MFKPLGMTQTEWRTEGKETLVCDINDPNSYPTLRLESNEGSDRNLYVSTRELASWGNLHLGGKNRFDYISDIQRFGNLSPVVLNQHSKVG